MVALKSNSNVAFLDQSQVSITNAQNQTVIAGTLANFGYDAAKMGEGQEVHTKAEQALESTRLESNEESVAYVEFAKLRDEVDRDYTLLRKKARVAFRNEPIALKVVGVDADKAHVFVNLVHQVRTLGSTLLGDEKLMAPVMRLNTSVEEVEALVVKCGQLEALRANYLIEKGESQHATQVKDAAFAELDNWMREFYAVAKIALEDQQQLLESLFITVKS